MSLIVNTNCVVIICVSSHVLVLLHTVGYLLVCGLLTHVWITSLLFQDCGLFEFPFCFVLLCSAFPMSVSAVRFSLLFPAHYPYLFLLFPSCPLFASLSIICTRFPLSLFPFVSRTLSPCHFRLVCPFLSHAPLWVLHSSL